MSMPLSNLLFDSRTGQSSDAIRFREIENHYHIESIAESSKELVRFQATALRAQSRAAALNVREMAKTRQTDERHFNALLSGMAQLDESLDKLNDAQIATRDAINEQTGLLLDALEELAAQMMAQHKTLLGIAKILRRPYKTQMLELREQADKWLTSGMKNTGKARADDFNDAMNLLHEVIKNPIGNQDYMTWFQIGWLRWKHDAKLPAAEEAFYRAARLSAAEANPYHLLAARHLAHMQYLQGRPEEAYTTIHTLIPRIVDRNAPFDAARYAARTGRRAEALALLEKCIETQPTTIISMFAEEDFLDDH